MSVTLYNTPEGTQDMGEVNNLMRKAMSDDYQTYGYSYRKLG